MSRRTLLDIVQDILDEMDYDDVNSIEDNDEALQIARRVRSAYDILVDDLALPCEEVFRKLIHVGITPTTYNQFTLPKDINEINEVKYLNSDTKYAIISYMEPLEFLELSNSTVSNTDKVVTTIDTIDYYIRTNKEPEYFTIINTSDGGEVLVFDSYDSTIDATGVSAAKTLALVEQRHSMTLTDTYDFPYLDESLVNLLVTDAKAKCFDLYKQRRHGHAERDNRRARIRSQNGKHRVKTTNSRKKQYSKNYGRRRP